MPDLQADSSLSCWIEQVVVVETDTDTSYIGTLVKQDEAGLHLRDALIFDQAYNRVPLEQFLIECAELGISPSRRDLWIRAARTIAVSPLAGVVVPGKE